MQRLEGIHRKTAQCGTNQRQWDDSATGSITYLDGTHYKRDAQKPASVCSARAHMLWQPIRTTPISPLLRHPLNPDTTSSTSSQVPDLTPSSTPTSLKSARHGTSTLSPCQCTQHWLRQNGTKNSWLELCMWFHPGDTMINPDLAAMAPCLWLVWFWLWLVSQQNPGNGASHWRRW